MNYISQIPLMFIALTSSTLMLIIILMNFYLSIYQFCYSDINLRHQLFYLQGF
jgi:hypothetical protein